MRCFFGAAIIGFVLLLLFVLNCLEMGLKNALITWGLALLMVCVLLFGVWLMRE